jgi:hypothetical protein
MANASLDSTEMQRLLTLVEEATRANAAGVEFFVEPAEGALRRATSKRHHIIFGRRGSGKSSLLRKAAIDLTRERRPMAWVDLESFKNHSYPDLLLSVLIKTMKEFGAWLETAAVAPANKTSVWKRFFGGKPTRPPFDRAACLKLREVITRHVGDLETQLHAADDAEVQQSESQKGDATDSSEDSLGITLGTKRLGVSGAVRDVRSRSVSAESKSTESFRRAKIEFLRRHVMDFQAIFSEMAKLSSGASFLFLDDLYHLRKPEQPLVLDYLHSMAKGHDLWLKVGTIKHRSNWYIHGSPPLGIKLGDDADAIDLDLTLEKYSLAKDFLRKILHNLARNVGLSESLGFVTDTGLDRLVLASGGVARDFLTIFRLSVAAARERGENIRGGRVGAEDVNVGAGEHEPTKRQEFRMDIRVDEEASLDQVFQRVRSFCLDSANSNCFLIEKDTQGQTADGVHELVDLKLLHFIRARVTVNTRQGRLYEAYMLDLSQYAGSRTKRGLELVEFWQKDSKDKLRKASLIFEERDKA